MELYDEEKNSVIDYDIYGGSCFSIYYQATSPKACLNSKHIWSVMSHYAPSNNHITASHSHSRHYVLQPLLANHSLPLF